MSSFQYSKNISKDHYKGKVSGRKMGPKSIITKEKEDHLVAYMMEMVRFAHLLSINDLKMKVAKTCQQRHIPFKDGIHGRS